MADVPEGQYLDVYEIKDKNLEHKQRASVIPDGK